MNKDWYLKNQIDTLIQNTTNFSPKKHKINEIRYYKEVGTNDAEPGKRYRMHQIAALLDVKRHARPPGTDAFPCTLCKKLLCKISCSDTILRCFMA